MSESPLYKVIFYNQNHIYEIYARAVYQSDMYGFIEVEELLFNQHSQLLVDPAEERLKNEFLGVKRSFVPMQNIVRIDEVEKEGPVKVIENGGMDKVTQLNFPSRMPKPKTDA